MLASIITINCDKDKNSEWLIYFVNSIRNVSDDIFLCVSENIENNLYDKLHSFTENVFKYSTYIDINRWKDILLNKADLSKYDYLLLANDSSYGPIYPLDEVMNAMYHSSADLWGITSHGKMKINAGKHARLWPRFVQTHFWTMKKSLFTDKRFEKYLKSLPTYRDLGEASEGFEFTFTRQVEVWGYQWDTYIDTKELENEDYFMSFILFDSYRLISKEKCPFLPRVIFDLDSSVIRDYNEGHDIPNVIKFIDKHTDYDVHLIWNDLIGRKDPADLLERLNLYYLGTTEGTSESLKCHGAIFAYLYYSDLIEESLEYINHVPNDFDIYIASDTEEKLCTIREQMERVRDKARIHLLLHENKGRDLSALLVLFKPYVMQYDLICFVHDKNPLK